MSIADNVRKVRQIIVEICGKAGLDPEKIALVAATKDRPVSQIKEAMEAGIRIIGENRLQEAKRKIAFLNTEDVEWHFIGHLQTNKVKPVI
ncbi:MAG: YggS family pyridoxal phosphate-dependent enzyme, partial [bacterium]